MASRYLSRKHTAKDHQRPIFETLLNITLPLIPVPVVEFQTAVGLPFTGACSRGVRQECVWKYQKLTFGKSSVRTEGRHIQRICVKHTQPGLQDS